MRVPSGRSTGTPTALMPMSCSSCCSVQPRATAASSWVPSSSGSVTELGVRWTSSVAASSSALRSAGCRLVLVTKGDLYHQEQKVARSGLVDAFERVEIVSEKDEATYRAVVERLGIQPAEFLMVGNTVRSDVLPVLAIGGRAVQVPYEITWSHEQAEHSGGFAVLERLSELPAWLAANG